MTSTKETIRAAFPSLQQKQIFLDNAARSQTLHTVADDIRTYLNDFNVQLSGPYRSSKQATEKYLEAHVACATYINAAHDEVVLGASTTQLLRNLSFSLDFHPGDEIIVTAVDHECNIAPWLDLAERTGSSIKWWRPDHPTNPRLLPSDLDPLLSPRTRLVACTHASNILGTITDIRAVAQTAHRVGALVCVDGVGYASHRPVDVKHLEVDFYALSWHKLYGPHMAMLYASRAAQQHVRSLAHFFSPHSTLTDRLGLSAASYELLQTLPRVIEYLGPSGGPKWAAMVEQEERLQDILLSHLRSDPRVTIYGELESTRDARVAIVSFTVEGWVSRKLVELVEAKSNHCLRSGSFSSERLASDLLGLKSDGAVRVSMLHYNTVHEITTLLETLDSILNKSDENRDESIIGCKV